HPVISCCRSSWQFMLCSPYSPLPVPRWSRLSVVNQPPVVGRPPPRWLFRRVSAAVGGALLSVYAIWWGRAFMVWRNSLIVWPLACASVAGYLWWFAIRGDDGPSRRLMASGCRSGVLFGLIGFTFGFLGPLIATPHANQGPLLGIFVTGPAGLMLGAFGGLIRNVVRHRRGA